LAREKSVAELPREYGFADLKGDLDQIGELAGGLAWQPSSLAWQHPAQSGHFSLASAEGAQGDTGSILGHAAQIAQRVAEQFKLRQDAFLAELSLEPLYVGYRKFQAARRYRPISRFPAVERDFSLILDDGTLFGVVRSSIEGLGIAELVSVEAVDLFRGKHVPAGKFSLLVRVTFQSQQATLTEPQVNEFSSRIIAALEQQLGAALRTA
jgi:phenylalanyl-tRNA synthetase beta chain